MNKRIRTKNLMASIAMLASLLSVTTPASAHSGVFVQIEKQKAFWVVMSNGNQDPLCVPAVAFLFKNEGTLPVGTIILKATFLNPAKKVVFATGSHWINDDGKIPPGYTFTGMVYGNTGFDYALGACSSGLPKLTVSATLEYFSGGRPFQALNNFPVSRPQKGGMLTYMTGQTQDNWLRQYVFK